LSYFISKSKKFIILMDNLISQAQFTAIDFESAGAARGKTDVPIQIGMAQWSLSGGYDESVVSFLHPSAEVTWSAQKIHGITKADLITATTLLSMWPVIKIFLADRVLVAHGKGTEKKFLSAFPGHGFGPWIDTLLLSRAVWPELADYSLGGLCDFFLLTDLVNQCCPDRDWHDALYDAVASLVLLEYVIKTLELDQASVELLLKPDQSAWFAKKNRRDY
jgi:DNA polymerase III subunit epsilon